MKINLNQTTAIKSTFLYKSRNQSESKNKANIYGATDNSVAPLYTMPNFYGKDPHAEFLMSQVNKLRCAYSDKLLLAPDLAKEIFQKLHKRANAQSAINLLQGHVKYMHDIEAIMFDIFKDAEHKNKRDFQDILIEEAPEALERLKVKQTRILNSGNKIIETLDNDLAEKVRAIRDEALVKIENDTFGRKSPLEKLFALTANGKDIDKLMKIYYRWHKLPSSSRDIDAFIVKYSKQSHENIAKRLLSTSIATIEHIIPQSRGGADSLSNYILVSAEYNNNRNSMPLDMYIQLTTDVDIASNLQKYLNRTIFEINNPKSAFRQKAAYPEMIAKTIRRETKGQLNLDTSLLHVPESVAKQDEIITQKLADRFRIKNSEDKV